MLDFTTNPSSTRHSRCQTRARIARKAARRLGIILAGLMGVALIQDPALATATRSNIAEVLQQIQLPARATDTALMERLRVETFPMSDASYVSAELPNDRR